MKKRKIFIWILSKTKMKTELNYFYERLNHNVIFFWLIPIYFPNRVILVCHKFIITHFEYTSIYKFQFTTQIIYTSSISHNDYSLFNYFKRLNNILS